jgi:hypothetical protein
VADTPCTWGTVDAAGRYPCATHKGGFLEVGARYCSKAVGIWAELERLNRTLANGEIQRTNAALEALGWTFTGFGGPTFSKWTARRGPAHVTADSGAELVRKVREAERLEPGPARQRVLL